MTTLEQNTQGTQNTSQQVISETSVTLETSTTSTINNTIPEISKSFDSLGNSVKVSTHRIKEYQNEYLRLLEEFKKVKAQYKKMKDSGMKDSGIKE